MFWSATAANASKINLKYVGRGKPTEAGTLTAIATTAVRFSSATIIGTITVAATVFSQGDNEGGQDEA